MREANAGDFIDQRLVTAISHPIRVRALELLASREASPKQLSETMEAPLSQLSYHVGVLKENGLLKEVRTEKRRGATEHFFRVVPRSFVGHWDWLRVPTALRPTVAATSLRTFFNVATFALGLTGGLDEDAPTMGWMTIVADPEGAEKLRRIARKAIAEAEAVQDQSIERCGTDRGRLRPLVFALHLLTVERSS